MRTIYSRAVYYPSFSIGCVPAAVPCLVSIVEANGKMHVKTPFAFVSAYSTDEDELNRLTMPGGGYYATEEECMAYLHYEYPHADLAMPIMDAWATEKQYSAICADGRIGDRCGVSPFSVPKLARGHRSFTRKQVRDAVNALNAK